MTISKIPLGLLVIGLFISSAPAVHSQQTSVANTATLQYGTTTIQSNTVTITVGGGATGSPYCSDGTAANQCSLTKPQYCSSGVLVDRASACGCPAGYTAQGDSCVAQVSSDQTPPVIGTLAITNITTQGAVISFSVDEQVSAEVQYGLSTTYGLTSLGQTSSRSFNITLSNLSAGTLYHVRSKATDIAQNSAVSIDYTFQTLPASQVDTIAPDAARNFRAANSTETSVDLEWTASGDDGLIGTAKTYDIRYSLTPIAGSNFAQASPVSGEPSPGAAGTPESFTVVGLSPGLPYYFALSITDEANNASPLAILSPYTTKNTPRSGGAVATSSVTVMGLDTPGLCYKHGEQLTVNFARNNVDHVAVYFTADGGTSLPVFGSWAAIQQSGDASTSIPVAIPSTIAGNAVRLWVEGHNTAHTERLALDASNEDFTVRTDCSVQPSEDKVIADDRRVNPPPRVAPATSGSGSGGSGGGFSSDSQPPSAVSNLRAQGANNQVRLTWKNPATDWVYTVIIRRENRAPLTPADGILVYQGKNEEFTDTNVNSGTTYFYNAYAIDRAPNYSRSATVSEVPKEGIRSFGVISTQIPLLSSLSFSQNLAHGSRGDQVTKLQQILARDKSVYPQGLVTSFYGQFTVQAVRNFQLKYNIAKMGDAEFGSVGEKTRAKLNQLSGIESVSQIADQASATRREKILSQIKTLQELLVKLLTLLQQKLAEQAAAAN